MGQTKDEQVQTKTVEPGTVKKSDLAKAYNEGLHPAAIDEKFNLEPGTTVDVLDLYSLETKDQREAEKAAADKSDDDEPTE